MNNSYLIPSYFFDNGNKVQNIAVYRNGTVMDTAGAKKGLFGWEFINKQIETIWLCEGVWDWLVMDEILFYLKKKKDLAIGVPGAGVFKQEWIQFFQDKKVHILFDNDDAGKNGSYRIHNLLVPSVKFISHLHWNPKLNDGYDIRDFYIDNDKKPLRTITNIRHHLKEFPRQVEGNVEDSIVLNKKEELQYTGKRISHENVYKVFKKWLHLPNNEMIDIMFGSVIANRLEGDPLWIFFVAPSGGTKTELLMSMSEAPEIEVISTLTPHTLVSGMVMDGGIDTSLLPKLDGKVVIIKDFTAILNMNKIHRDEIFGILRDAYDGEFNKPFGNGQWKRYKSKFGIIAGVTPAIEKFIVENISMGERFLRYNIPMDNSIQGRKQYIRRAITNTTNELKMRQDLKEISNKVLDYDYKIMPDIPNKIHEKIICLSHFVCMARGYIDRDKFTKEVVSCPYVEVGTRIAKEIVKLCYGIGMFKGIRKIGMEEYNIAKSIAKSSVLAKHELIIKYIYGRNNTPTTSKEISDIVGLPPLMIDRIIQDLFLNKVLEKYEKKSAFNFSWRIEKDSLDLIEESGIYE